MFYIFFLISIAQSIKKQTNIFTLYFKLNKNSVCMGLEYREAQIQFVYWK